MRFLLDVHVAASIGRALAEQGHDVVRASDNHARSTDTALLDLAVRDGRVLITEDRDFSDLIYRHGAPPPLAIVYLRYGAPELPGIAERILLVLANTRIDDHMVVIGRTGVRRRILPGKEQP